MHGFRKAYRSVVVVLLLLTTTTAAANKEDGSDSNSNSECGLYFAESTIPNSGMGVFAGRGFTKGSIVIDGDVAIPLMEVEWNNDFEDWPFLWNDYAWSGMEVPYMEEEVEGSGAHAAIMGVGSAINSMLPLVNVKKTCMSADGAGLHRSKDPGAGAFTPYHECKTFATKDIEPGAELFVSYGELYFEDRAWLYGMMPFHEDYEKADKLLLKYKVLLEKLEATGHSDKLQNSLWGLVTTKMLGSESPTLNALPKNFSHVEKALNIGTANLFYDQSVRSIQWLQQHGKCTDNIRPGMSTMDQAGRGAFATRFIPKGGLVAPAPLIHIPDRERLHIYDSLPEDEDGEKKRNSTAVVHRQLLLNYCFGHRNSTLLMSPYGIITSLINHSSNKKPNTRVQWSDTMSHPEWMDKPVTALKSEVHTGLSFDFVALEDIHEGDEILIDYGKEWQDAWDDHVRSWIPPEESDRYQAGFELSNNLDLELWPYDEKPYYAPTFQVWVHEAYREIAGNAEEGEEVEYRLIRITKKYVWNEQTLYMAEIIHRHGDNDVSFDHCSEEVTQVLFGIPKDAIYFEDDPYTRDVHLHTSFRHEMMIPDDMFPEAWKNL